MKRRLSGSLQPINGVLESRNLPHIYQTRILGRCRFRRDIWLYLVLCVKVVMLYVTYPYYTMMSTPSWSRRLAHLPVLEWPFYGLSAR